MKNLKEFITEGQKHIDRATIGDFVKWACLGELPDGKDGKVEPEDCEGLLDNGWFDNFDDSDPKKACKEIADFLNNNWNENIKVTSKETSNDWEVSFKLNGKEYVAAFVDYFGDLSNR